MITSERLKVLVAQNGIFVALLLLIAFFAIAHPRFFSLSNGQTLLLQITELGIVALPLAFIVMTASVDLSVGSIASLSAVISGTIMVGSDSILLGVAAGLTVGAVAGALNGFLIAYLGLSPLVVTLGALSVWGGLSLVVTSGATVTGLPQEFRGLGTATIGPIPLQMIVLIFAILFAAYVLNRRPLGRQVLAIGGNARASRLLGINVRRVQLQLFIVSGIVASLAGIMLSAKLQAASPAIGSGLEIQALTVVLLGGVAFTGGSGRISGVVAGLLFVGVLRNGLIILGVSPFVQTTLIGLTLIVGVAMDSSIQRLVRDSWARTGRRALVEATEQGSNPAQPFDSTDRAKYEGERR